MGLAAPNCRPRRWPGSLRQLAREDDRSHGLDAELRFADESGERLGTATVLDCLSATLRRGEQEFIAYDGDFYRVSKSFVARIDAEARRVANLGFRPTVATISSR